MLQKLLLFCLLLAAGGHAAQAQTTLASETYKQRLRGRYLHNDTAQALINLYGTRQAGGAGWVAGGILSAVRLSIGGTGSTNQSPYAPRTEAPGLGVALLVASPFLAYGAGKIAHYSNANLERILTGYAAGQPLARSVRRKLKPRFFKLPIVQYQRVPVTAVPAPKAPAPAAVPAAPAKASAPAVPAPAVLAAPVPVPDVAAPAPDVPAPPTPAAPAFAPPVRLYK